MSRAFLNDDLGFCSASALLEVQTAVIATADLPVPICLSGCEVVISVCLPVMFRCFVQTNENTIVRSLAAGRTSILVSWHAGKVYLDIRRGLP